MSRYFTRLYAHAKPLLILGIAFASCKGGPVAPGEAPIQLSTTSLLFTNSDTQQVVIKNLRSDPVDWRILSTTASWLQAAPGAGSIGPSGTGALTVQIDRSAVPQGNHSAILQIGAGNSSLALNVSVQPAEDPAEATLQPTSLMFSPAQSEGWLDVLNTGGSSLEWSLVGPQWATLSPAKGTLQPGGRTQVFVTVQRTGLGAGLYQGTIQLNSSVGSRTSVATLEVSGGSGLRLEPATLDFGTAGSSTSLRVVNETEKTLHWNARPEGSWILLSPSSGQLPPRLSQVLTVNVSRGNLAHGTNQAPILFSTEDGTTSATVRAAIQPAEGPGSSTLDDAEIAVNPTALDFGATASDLSFTVINDGDSQLDWTAISGASWISLPLPSGRVSPHSNSPVSVKVSRAGLTPGDYQSTVRFESPVGTVTSVVKMTVKTVASPPPPVSPPSQPPSIPGSGAAKVVITPAVLDFGSTITEMSFEVQNTGGSTLTWSALPSNGWITLMTAPHDLAPGTSQNVTVRVTRNAATPPGNYQGSIQVSSNGGPATVSVSLQVTESQSPAAAKLVVTPSSLSFGLTATELTFTIQNAGGTGLNWSGQPGNTWVSLPTSSGQVSASGSQTVTILVSRSVLSAAGTYQSTIQISSNGGSATVAVSLQVPAAAAPPAAPKLGVSPNTLDFGLTATEKSFTITNTGGTALTWTAQSSNAWLTLPTSAGQIAAGGSQTITVRVSRAGLTSSGTYQSTVQLTSNGGSTSVAVSLQIPTPTPPPAGSSTVDVRDFGAVGDGVTDDAPAFDAAIRALPSTGGTVVIPAGTYRLAPVRVGPHRPIDLWRKSNVTLAGAGMDQSILKMAPATYTSSVFFIGIYRGSNITLRDFTVDGNASNVTYLDEQSHIISVDSSEDITIQRLRLTGSGGDAIKLIGISDAGDPWTDGVTIVDSHFSNTRRNGVSVQRGVRNLTIRGNTFELISQQAISSEPTGFVGAPTDILVENNVLRGYSAAWALALAGGGKADPLKRVIIRNNTIINAAAYLLWIDDLTVENNSIAGDRFHSALRLQDIGGGHVTGNTISGLYENGAGLLQLLNYDEAMSNDVEIRNNTIDASAGFSGIYVRDATGGITIAGNRVFGGGSNKGIAVETILMTGFPRSGFTVTSNTVTDFLNAISIVARGDKFSQVVISSNILDHDQHPATPTVGIVLDRTGPIQEFGTIASNEVGPGILTTIQVLGGN